MRTAAGVALAALALHAPRAAAQSDCFPPKNSNEARTMATFDVPLAFGPAAAPPAADRPAGRWYVGIDVSTVPNVSRGTATPTTCRPGKGPENTDLLFAAPRPRIAVTLPAGFMLEGSWIPPVKIGAVEANVIGASLARVTRLDRRGSVLSVRAHLSVGVIKAPITCNDAALEEVNSECYRGTRSNDAFKPNVFGVEAAVGWRLGRVIHPYLGAGYNHLAPRFQVNFTNQVGDVDRRKVSVDLDRGVLFAGVTWNAATAFDLGAEMYAVPADAITARLSARIRLGR
ncbi:MAG: hypothetical protein HOP28_11640 [Gemmatimonadales bacterium]|nr:hypothetical protein [Gemmatimonadales bacterium]